MRKFRIIVLLVSLGLAACGGGGGGDVDVASQDKKADGDGSGGDAEATAGDADDPKFTGKGGKDFCEYLQELERTEEDLDLGTGENTKENREKAKKTLDVFSELEDKAPPEIRADVKLVIDLARPIFQRIADGKDLATAPSSAPPTEAESKAYEEANKRVEAYSKNVCGIDDDGDSGGGSTGDGGTDDGGTDGGTTDEQAPADETVPPEG